MLDAFLEVAYQKESSRSLRNEMAEAMTALPNDELAKIASGEVKLAYMVNEGHSGGCWLDQFKETPLYDEAIQLEQMDLQVEAQDIQLRSQERAQRDGLWDTRDAISLKKRLLELKLRQGEAGGAEAEETPEEEAAEEEAGVHEVAPEPPAAAPPAPPEPAPKQASALEAMRKEAKELTMAGREHIKSKNFAIPKGNGPGDTGKYPIHDRRHAANALTRVRQNGSPSEKSKVYSAVAKKYPGMAAESSIPAVEKKASIDPELIAEMRLEALLEKHAAALPVSPSQAADQWGRRMAHMEKDAFLGALAGAARATMPAVKAGLAGAGKGLMGAGKALKGAHAAGGMAAVGKKIPTVLAGMAGKAGRFAQANPMAAGLMGAGALGAAGLGGAAIS